VTPNVGPDPDLLGRETVLREIRADRTTYWRDHLVLAAVAAVAAGAVLYFIDSTNWWVGPVGAVLALAVRGVYLASEVMAQVWYLTQTRLIGPGGRVVRLADVTRVRRLRNDVQLVTRAGDKHLMKHIPGAAGLVAEIEVVRAGGSMGGRGRTARRKGGRP
jgi:hypothetical protein